MGIIASVLIALVLVTVAIAGILTSSEPSNIAQHRQTPEPALPAPKIPSAEPKTSSSPKPAQLEPPIEPLDKSLAPLPEAKPPAEPPVEPATPPPPVNLRPKEPSTPPVDAKTPDTRTEPKPPAPDIAAPTPAPSAGNDAMPNLLRDVLPLLAKRDFDAADAKTRTAADLGDTLREALGRTLASIRADDQAVRAALAALVGKQVKLATARETVTGKLASAEPPVLKVERPIVINGEVRGTHVTELRLDELTPDTREAFLPAAASLDAWAGRTLVALCEMRVDAAAKALAHLDGHALKDALTAEMARAGATARENQALAVWNKLLETAEGAVTLTRVRQVLADLETFEKDFATTAFFTQSYVAEKRATLRKQCSSLEAYLDPRVQKLFKGRVLSYEARTGAITLAYDLTTKEQLDDFEGIVWAPPGDHTGVLWKKEALSFFAKDVHNRLLVVPMITPDSLRFQAKVSALRLNMGKRVCFFVTLFRDKNDPGTHPYVNFDKAETKLADNGKDLFTSTTVLLNQEGPLEVICTEKTITVKINGHEFTHPFTPSSKPGMSLDAGWDSGLTLSYIQVSGRLSPEWLAKALSAAKP